MPLRQDITDRRKNFLMNINEREVDVLIDQIEKDRLSDNIVSISPVKVYTQINKINQDIKAGMTLNQALSFAAYTEKNHISKPHEGEKEQ